MEFRQPAEENNSLCWNSDRRIVVVQNKRRRTTSKCHSEIKVGSHRSNLSNDERAVAKRKWRSPLANSQLLCVKWTHILRTTNLVTQNFYSWVDGIIVLYSLPSLHPSRSSLNVLLLSHHRVQDDNRFGLHSSAKGTFMGMDFVYLPEIRFVSDPLLSSCYKFQVAARGWR